jgi:enoyl-CoA hydratase
VSDALGTDDVTAEDTDHAGVGVRDVDGVRILTFDRPRRRNAVDRRMALAIADAVQEMEEDPALRVLVLTGAGGSFCSGMDLSIGADGPRPVVPGRGFAGLTRRPPARPVVAAVEGHAAGGGFEIVLACDLVVASTTAVFSLPETRRGLVPGAGGLLRLPAALPRAVASRMALTGAPLSGQRAHELGLVNVLTSPGEALGQALDLAREVAANAPLAVRAARRILDEGPSWPADRAWSCQDQICREVRESEDAGEGTAAFLERRPPVWTGK